jgi:hypothetical protein
MKKYIVAGARTAAGPVITFADDASRETLSVQVDPEINPLRVDKSLKRTWAVVDYKDIRTGTFYRSMSFDIVEIIWRVEEGKGDKK